MLPDRGDFDAIERRQATSCGEGAFEERGRLHVRVHRTRALTGKTGVLPGVLVALRLQAVQRNECCLQREVFAE